MSENEKPVPPENEGPIWSVLEHLYVTGSPTRWKAFERAQAAFKSQEISEFEYQVFLRAALTDPDPFERDKALQMLEKVAEKEDHFRFMRASHDPHYGVRCSAVDALGNYDDEATRRRVERRAISDPNKAVRLHAVWSLYQLTEADFIIDWCIERSKLEQSPLVLTAIFGILTYEYPDEYREQLKAIIDHPKLRTRFDKAMVRGNIKSIFEEQARCNGEDDDDEPPEGIWRKRPEATMRTTMTNLPPKAN